jgi:myo-inositol-1(or 4)-monophosphatase
MIDWLAACGELADAVAASVAALDRSERSVPGGRGAGGDTTYRIDAVAEAAVCQGLEALAAHGTPVRLVSEELGERIFGVAPETTVVLDPIDGSLNARRGLGSYAVSIAVAHGDRIGDVDTALVQDLVLGERFTARRGAGAWCDGRRLGATRPGAEWELCLFEATTKAQHVAAAAAAVAGHTRRLRILGSLAVSLCQLADGRADAVATLAATRAVDIAAATLIVQEAGAAVLRQDGAPIETLPLDTTRRVPIVAARDAEHATRLARLLRPPTG